MTHAVCPDTAFENRAQRNEHAQNNRKNNEEDTGAGVMTLAGGSPVIGKERRFKGGEEGHFHIGHGHAHRRHVGHAGHGVAGGRGHGHRRGRRHGHAGHVHIHGEGEDEDEDGQDARDHTGQWDNLWIVL